MEVQDGVLAKRLLLVSFLLQSFQQFVLEGFHDFPYDWRKGIVMKNPIGKALPLISVFSQLKDCESTFVVYTHFCTMSKPNIAIFGALG